MTERIPSFSLGLALAVVAMAASGCATSPQQNHRKGLFDEISDLEPANKSVNFSSVHARESAQWLAATRAPSSHIIGATGVHAVAPTAVVDRARTVQIKWPLKQVQITSPYGQRGHEFHEGVDLRARVGTPVYASHSGQVLYASDHIRGYGKMIVLRHSSGLATIYAHASRLLVRKGQWVSQGMLIGYTGNSGHSHGPHLHFEVRSGVNTINPVSLLPRPKFSAQDETRGKAKTFLAQE